MRVVPVHLTKWVFNDCSCFVHHQRSIVDACCLLYDVNIVRVCVCSTSNTPLQIIGRLDILVRLFSWLFYIKITMEEKGCKSSKSSCDSVPEKDEKEVGFSANEIKKKNPDYLLEKKIFLPYGVGPDVDCEIDDDSDEPDYSSYVQKRPIDEDYLLKRKVFLPYGVGPDIDCEIDDDNDEPDYLSYASVPKEDIVEDSSTPGDAVP